MKGGYVVLGTLGAAAVVVMLSVLRPGAIEDLNLRAYDELLRRTGRPPVTGHVSIVAVDDNSIAEIGQWPWRRDVMARLVDRVSDLGARVIAFDVILSEPDRLGSAQETRNAGEVTGTTTDAALAAALKHQRVVTSYAFTFDGYARSAGCVLHPLHAVQVIGIGEAAPPKHLFHPSGVICSLSVLDRAAVASGFLNVSPDSDGIIRRVPLLMAYR